MLDPPPIGRDEPQPLWFQILSAIGSRFQVAFSRQETSSRVKADTARTFPSRGPRFGMDSGISANTAKAVEVP